MSDDGDTEAGRATKPMTVALPKREPITLGFMTCARAAGKSVRECACKIKGGGWLECPPEFCGVLARSDPAKLRSNAIFPTAKEMALNGTLSDPLPTITLPPTYRPDPEPIGELGLEPKTPQQIAAAIAAEKADFKRMKSRQALASGYTGNFCDNCGSSKMRTNGTCEVCDECGHTGACG